MTSEPVCKILKCARRFRSRTQVVRHRLTSRLAEAAIRSRNCVSSTSCQTIPPSCVPLGVYATRRPPLTSAAVRQVAGQSRSFVKTELKEEENEESAAEDRDSSLDESSMLIITVSLIRDTRSRVHNAEPRFSSGCKFQRQEHPAQANRADHLHGAHWCVMFARLSFRTTSDRRSSPGCFVPAEDALVGLTDRIMTRVSTRESITRVINLSPPASSSLELRPCRILYCRVLRRS